MINVLFFAQLRERLQQDRIELTQVPSNVGQLRAYLSENGERWQQALSSGKCIAAVNQTIVDDSFSLTEGDEVAFFPPVTGG